MAGGTINTGSFARALWPGINKWFGQSYEEHPVEFSKIFDKETSTKLYEEDVATSMFGLAAVKEQGDGIAYDSARQLYVTRFTNVTYGLGFIITREMFEDDQYNVIGKQRSKALAFSMRQTKEIVGASVLNTGFTAFTTGDAVFLLSASHVKESGTWSNLLGTASDLNSAALEQAAIDIMNYTDARGNKISIMPQKLIIPTALAFEAERILKSALEYSTSENAINALKSRGTFPQGIEINHYLTDTDAWFIKTNCTNGLKYFQRRDLEFAPAENDFDTENARYKATERYVFGCSDPRSIYGSPGT